MTRRDILTAVPTAFAENGDLDIAGSRAILEYVAKSGNEGAFVLGTTGEFAAMSQAERKEVMDAALEILSPVMRVVVHVGAPSTYEALQLVEQVKAAGGKEIAALTPYYLPASDEVLFRHFEAISKAAGDDLDIYIYVFRARTGNWVSEELLARLAELPNVVGAKISGESSEQVAAYRRAVPADFILYTGADRELAVVTESGDAQGVVSGISSIVPKPFRELAEAAASGDADRLAAAQAAADDAVAVLTGDPARLHRAYEELGIPGGFARMNTEIIDAELDAEIVRVVAAYR